MCEEIGGKAASPNPRENVEHLEAEIGTFLALLYPLIQGKSPEMAAKLFNQRVGALYDAVGQPFKWPYQTWYYFRAYWIDQKIDLPGDAYYIYELPGPGQLTEEEAIGVARETVLLLTDLSPEALDAYWITTGFYKAYPGGDPSWYVKFVEETPGAKSPYAARLFMEIDPRSGHIFNFFDLR
ncbi:MAG TPA: hypothetical protein PKE04_08755 [Clostridia bacterium]|nr:hypothetical protein [Clostridia bacterium]